MRARGFYWVRTIFDRWIVAHYFGPRWQIPGDEASLDDSYFSEIDERRLERQS